ncbi:MAG: phosphopantetheine-binding protein [Clostridiales bacterium]|jgi:acyl carrier protein|nr:phosphopantetheine-binding protein [Clostridiales bacterium]
MDMEIKIKIKAKTDTDLGINKIKADLHEAYKRIYEMDIEDSENFFLKSGDSVLHMAFASTVRDMFKVTLSMEEYESNTSLEKLADLIRKKMKPGEETA